jgi:hypothetical protein
MSRAFLVAFCVLLQSVVFGAASIRECASIAELRTLADKNTLIVCDLDDTIFRAKQMLGSSVWFDETVKQQSTPESIQQVIELWESVQSATQVVLMEPITADEVGLLQRSGAMVVAMTARGYNIWASTIRQLRSVGIDFDRASRVPVLFSLQNMPGTVFFKGILFTTGGHKGRALKEFLRQIQYTPEKVIYINDKKEPLEEVASTLPHSIEYIGLRYAPADQVRDAYKPNIAKVQYEHFSEILSDIEAASVATP